MYIKTNLRTRKLRGIPKLSPKRTSQILLNVVLKIGQKSWGGGGR